MDAESGGDEKYGDGRRVLFLVAFVCLFIRKIIGKQKLSNRSEVVGTRVNTVLSGLSFYYRVRIEELLQVISYQAP